MLVFKKTSRIAMTVIEIRPHRWGWDVESPGVKPVFPEKDQAINYAQNRASFRSGPKIKKSLHSTMKPSARRCSMSSWGSTARAEEQRRHF